MQQHLLEQYFASVFHAQSDHSQTVTHEDHIHTGVVGDMGAGEVMGRDHGDRFTPLVQRAESSNGHFFARVGGRSAHWGVRAPSCLGLDIFGVIVIVKSKFVEW